MSHQEIFNQFCNYVNEHIFSDESVGSYVSFVVDGSFIKDFCNMISCDERTLMTAVRVQLYYNRRDIKSVKGILAIQLYAASKRANSDGVTEKNYRDRLSQVLDWDMNDLQSWMSDNQEIYWETLYNWCDTHFFQITKCQRKTGAGRYVQYPVNQALRVFTEEDLKYIAAYFVEKRLMPGEDIQEKDFWRIISQHRISFYVSTHHGRNVICNSVRDIDYLNQVFHYYLRWTGEYKSRNRTTVFGAAEKDSYLYFKKDNSRIDFRDGHLHLLRSIDLESLHYSDMVNSFTFKYEGMILFRQDDIYDDYMQECRFLEQGEEGLALCFIGKCKHQVCKSDLDVVFKNKQVKIYRIKESYLTKDLYTSHRFYELSGGLKIGRHAYLQGAAPILKLEHFTKFWVDGNPLPGYHNELSVSLNDLKVGFHYIKIPNYKKIEIEICKPTFNKPFWLIDNNKWEVNNEDAVWDSDQYEPGIVGLDFSCIPQTRTDADEKNVITRWASFHTFGTFNDNENNIAVKLLRNI